MEARLAIKRPDLTGGGLLRSYGSWGEVKRIGNMERIKGDERILGDSAFVGDNFPALVSNNFSALISGNSINLALKGHPFKDRVTPFLPST